MCGRYFQETPPERLSRYFDMAIRENFPARYNIAPTQPVGIVRAAPRADGAGREYALARWGFVPSWAKEVAGKPLINARSETVAEKPTFRAAFKRRRCLVPADGFYEWASVNGKKTPHAVRPAAGGPIAFAGIWETWAGPDGSELDSCAILTAAAGSDIEALHAREPVVIAPADFGAWLTIPEHAADEALGLLRSSEPGFWRPYEVGPEVGAVRNDYPELAEPAARQGSLL